MSVLFYGTSAGNGFDSIGHYVRAEPLVGGCTAYVKTPVAGVFGELHERARRRPRRRPTLPPRRTRRGQARSGDQGDDGDQAIATHSTDTLKGLLGYLIGSSDEAAQWPRRGGCSATRS